MIRNQASRSALVAWSGLLSLHLAICPIPLIARRGHASAYLNVIPLRWRVFPCSWCRGLMPRAFAAPGAFGDLFAVVLAWVALILLRRPGRIPPRFWLFNLWGAGDLLLHSTKGLFDADFHPRHWAPRFTFRPYMCPFFCVYIFMLFALLLRARSMSTNAAAGS